MKIATPVLALALGASAFPAVMEQLEALGKRQVGVPSTSAARALSASRTNCGPIPCVGWDAKAQYVSTTGDHAYASPAADEIRGLCPGLNAAANHGYLSRSGVTTIEETIVGLGAAYGLEAAAAGILAAYAVIFDGDPVLGTWSIGGPPSGDSLTKGLLGGAQGLSYSHNVYEGDSSIGRNDAYLNKGDAHSLNVTRFASAFATNDGNDRYTLDLFAQNFASKVEESIANNPYYFSARGCSANDAFSTVVVVPAAFNFVINLMSNHSEEIQSGYLNGAMFKQFFAISGEHPNFRWNKGQERIPDNWYRRPVGSEYGLPGIGGDVAINYLAYPDSFRLGGNTNGVNSFVGVDLGDLTSGAYDATNLLDTSGNGTACFLAQLTQAIVPDSAAAALGQLSAITSILDKYVKPIGINLDCPVLDKYDQTLFNNFPGYQYSPVGPATNY